MMDKSAFADRIAKLRVAKGLSQHQLSQMLGVKRSVVSYYESGDRLPSYDVLMEMSRVFNVSTDYLLRGKDASRVIQVSDLSEKELDVVMGVIGILNANAMMGELSPAMALAIGSSHTYKILLPINRCHIHVVSVEDIPLSVHLDNAVKALREYLEQA